MRCPSWADTRVHSAVYMGATALVPPVERSRRRATTFHPVSGSALPDPSGRPRPGAPPSAELGLMPRAAWYAGTGKAVLTPLPPAPAPRESSFHTVSVRMRPRAASRVVPPQAQTCGLEAGNPGCGRPSISPLVDPESPAAALNVTPWSAPVANAESSPLMP